MCIGSHKNTVGGSQDQREGRYSLDGGTTATVEWQVLVSWGQADRKDKPCSGGMEIVRVWCGNAPVSMSRDPGIDKPVHGFTP